MSDLRRRWSIAAAATVGLGAAAIGFTVGPAEAAPVTEEFEYTGAAEDFVVPEGVCEVTIDAFGAEGGGPPLPITQAPEGFGSSVPGLGGRATATIPVTPGETLIVRVGGQGEPPTFIATSPAEGSPFTAGVGGFNGGGDAATDPGNGSGGGGASDVRQGGDGLSNRVVVAGGGGGIGFDGDEDEGGGGAGGGAEGTEGQDTEGGSDAGDGGTQTAGGAGGTTDPTAGDGTAGEGGVGGSGSNDDEGGGGGGGGFFGGGGGAGDTDDDSDSPPGATDGVDAEGKVLLFEDAGGGGGGSGFGPAGVAFETGVQSGNGALSITYDPADGGCEPDVEPDVVQATPPFTG